MYKMLILDDEYLVRMGLKETIDWTSIDVEIIGEASNGKVGLEMARNLKPDIIISDVRMPIMDGLEFMKAVKQENMDTICIMLSGYKDFEYAKNTLETGAYTYLLKPVDCDLLVNTVKKSITELVKRRSDDKIVKSITTDLPLIKNTIIQSLVSGNYQSIEDIVKKNDIYQLKIPQDGYIIYGRIDNAINYTDNKIVKKAIDSLYAILLKHIDASSVGVMYYSHFIVLTPNNPTFIELTKVIKEYEKQNDLIISLGISDEYNSFSSIYEKYLDAKKIVKNKLFLTLNTISYQNENIINYRKVVNDAIKYIAQNYAYNFDITTICNDLNISPSHLMHIFKEDVGKTFNEFLTEYRINVAKQLLIQGKYKVYEIAEQIGYTDPKYFSQVFKKITGLTPQDFINEM